jgi:prepilin-type N-terminal cleavage/methylation domain-containing protein
MPPSAPHPRSPSRLRSARGFSLVESMVSLAILAVALLGVMRLQVVASGQNQLARRTATAASVARDFSEAVQRWDYDDPRLDTAEACAATHTDFPLTDALLGNAQVPAKTLDYAAAPEELAADWATAHDALGASYDGHARELIGDPAATRIQLLWSVRLVYDNPDLPGCELKLVSVVVRYWTGQGGNYRNLVTSAIKYDPDVLMQGGIPEAI